MDKYTEKCAQLQHQPRLALLWMPKGAGPSSHPQICSVAVPKYQSCP